MFCEWFDPGATICCSGATSATECRQNEAMRRGSNPLWETAHQNRSCGLRRFYFVAWNFFRAKIVALSEELVIAAVFGWPTRRSVRREKMLFIGVDRKSSSDIQTALLTHI